MQEHSNHIDQELLVKYLLNEVNEEELERVEEWMSASPANKKEVERLREIWTAGGAVEDFESINAEKDWEAIKGKMSFKEEEKVRKMYSMETHSYFSLFSRIAAIIVVVAGVSLFLHRLYWNKEIVVVAIPGENKNVTLPDGSKVILNGNSRLAYREDFKENRELSLEGEAFFDVVKNSAFPFKVRVNNTITEVLGTSFNVNEFQKKITVTLITGKIAFYNEGKEKEKVIMTKGDQVVYEKGKISVDKTNDLNVLAWKEKRIIFDDVKLSAVVATLENYFKIKIDVANPTLLNCNYTGTFENPELEKIINIVEATLDAKVEKKGQTYLLNGKGCE